MQVTIVRKDGFVAVDGKGHGGLNLAFMPATLRAVQWENGAGAVEMANGQVEYIASLEPYQPALDAWAVADAAVVDVSAAAVLRASKRAALAAHRYVVETGGVTLGAEEVLTDRESQALLTGAFVSITSGLIPNVEWKLKLGWMTVEAADIAVVAGAVAAHVRKTFAVERVVWEQIGLVADEDLPGFDVLAAWDVAWAAAG